MHFCRVFRWLSRLDFSTGRVAPGSFMPKVIAMRPFFIRWLVTTAAVWVAAPIAGLHYDHDRCLIAASLILGIINAFVRPLILLLSLPFIILTLGLGILVVNALLLMVVSGLVPCFHVDSFGHAFFGALMISIVSWILSAFIRSDNGRVQVRTISRDDGRIKQAKGRVIE
jgi:putative membrane protein